jgi:hypothetical protein
MQARARMPKRDCTTSACHELAQTRELTHTHPCAQAHVRAHLGQVGVGRVCRMEAAVVEVATEQLDAYAQASKRAHVCACLFLCVRARACVCVRARVRAPNNRMPTFKQASVRIGARM